MYREAVSFNIQKRIVESSAKIDEFAEVYPLIFGLRIQTAELYEDFSAFRDVFHAFLALAGIVHSFCLYMGLSHCQCSIMNLTVIKSAAGYFLQLFYIEFVNSYFYFSFSRWIYYMRLFLQEIRINPICSITCGC